MVLNSNSLHCRKRRRLHYWNPRLPGKTARVAMPQDHLTSLGTATMSKKMVVNEGPSIMESQAENKQTACTLRVVWTGKETPGKGLQTNCENSIKSSEGVLTSEGRQYIRKSGSPSTHFCDFTSVQGTAQYEFSCLLW